MKRKKLKQIQTTAKKKFRYADSGYAVALLHRYPFLYSVTRFTNNKSCFVSHAGFRADQVCFPNLQMGTLIDQKELQSNIKEHY